MISLLFALVSVLSGRAFADGKAVRIEQLPTNYLRIESALGLLAFDEPRYDEALSALESARTAALVSVGCKVNQGELRSAFGGHVMLIGGAGGVRVVPDRRQHRVEGKAHQQ